MQMRMLFTGRGTSGSWQIRGLQMARALGADAIPHRRLPRLRDYDVIVAVKRVSDDLRHALRASGRPWIWDVVDAYPQPECAAWSREQAVAWVRHRLLELQPTGVIWPNARMREDIGTAGAVIYHHHRSGIAINPVRERIRVVGYEGAPSHLGHWHDAFTRAAEAIGARFDERCSPAESDVIVAVRGGAQDCYACRNWKSNVKLANAHGSGTPFIGQADPGYVETAAGGEVWVESPSDVADALARLAAQSARRQIAERFRAQALPVAAPAEALRSLAESVA